MILIPQYRTARRSARKGSIAFLQSASDINNLTTYTFAAQNLGAAAADRQIIVAVHYRNTGPPILTSLTIAGVSATFVVDQQSAINRTNVVIANVPTGTSGDIVATFDVASARCTIGVYRAVGINSTAHATSADNNSPSSVIISVPAGGIVCSAHTARTTSTAWSGATPDYSDFVESTLYCSGRAAEIATSATITEELTQSGIDPAFVSVSWGPA
jgi:hypothetical protein